MPPLYTVNGFTVLTTQEYTTNYHYLFKDGSNSMSILLYLDTLIM